MNGVDLVAIAAIIVIIAALARMVRRDIIAAQASNAEILRETRIKARAEALRDVDREADEYSDIRSKDAIRSAVWAIKRRERAMAAAGAVMNHEFGETA